MKTLPLGIVVVPALPNAAVLTAAFLKREAWPYCRPPRLVSSRRDIWVLSSTTSLSSKPSLSHSRLAAIGQPALAYGEGKQPLTKTRGVSVCVCVYMYVCLHACVRSVWVYMYVCLRVCVVCVCTVVSLNVTSEARGSCL